MDLKQIVLALCASGWASAGETAYTKNGLVWSEGALRLNHVQVVGTHNSYHAEAGARERAAQHGLAAGAPEGGPGGGLGALVPDLAYSHAQLELQLEYQHVRSLELDVLADPEGGNYADPLVRRLVGLPAPADPEYRRPGTKVLHIADVDVNTVCTTLVGCLRRVKAWVEARPAAVPVLVLVELKAASPWTELLGGARVVAWANATLLDGLDAEIRSVFAPGQLVTPDDVRRPGLSLEASVLRFGWPDVDSARGRVLFLMDNAGAVRDAYRAGRPGLEGRVLFTNAAPGDADCAFQKLNDASTDAAAARIRRQAAAGYLVRTRADVPLADVRGGCAGATRDRALASGAHVVSSDFPAVGMSARWGCDYAVRLPAGRAGRCNPVTGRATCAEHDELEPRAYRDN